MKRLFFLIIPLTLLNCSKEETEKTISPLVGSFEGTVDYGGGFIMNTYVIIEENGNTSWDLFLKGENGEYIERYYWPSISIIDVSDDPNNWLYGKIESSETRRLIYSAAAEESGLYTSVANGLTDMPIGWNAHYSVMDFDETLTTYLLRNVCVPQEFQLADDELCEGWEQWEFGTQYFGTRVN